MKTRKGKHEKRRLITKGDTNDPNGDVLSLEKKKKNHVSRRRSRGSPETPKTRASQCNYDMKALSERAATRVSGSAAPSILGDIIILARVRAFVANDAVRKNKKQNREKKRRRERGPSVTVPELADERL